MLSSDVVNPPRSDLNSLAVVVSPPPGDGSDRRRSEHHGEGASTAATASHPPPPPPPHHSLTNSFSIREYAFRSRSKDIYKNWPFSRKNLHLCLKHGVSEVLPPFQHLDTARCRSFEIPKFENRSVVVEKNRVANKSEPSSSKSKKVFPSLLRSDRAAAEPVRSSAKDDVPLVTTQISRSLPQTAGKKCRFIVKLGAKSERSLGDDAASNCTSVSENMASKVCPVCKTFSSSSNTTLNAHIDQCLSLESAPQRLTIRHRIKPRKTRLMVDIYETAPRCTIEELNRRNGLNWANPWSLPAPNADMTSDDERRPSAPMVRGGNPSDAGAVYIDAYGTKLRILSKFDDDPSELLGGAEEAQLKKSSRGKKGSGTFKKKTKKLREQTRYKYLKLASKGKKLRSQASHESQLFAKQKNLRGTCGEGSRGHTQSSQGPLKPGLSGAIVLWSSSKRTGPKKKFVRKDGENTQTPTRSRSPNLLGISENSVYSRSSESEKERSWPDCRALEHEQTLICKRSLAWSDVMSDSIEKWGFPPAKIDLPKEDRFREVNAGRGESQLRQKKGTEIHAVVAGGSARTLRPRPSATKALRFSTLRKRARSLCQSSENSSDISAGQMGFQFKKPKLPSEGASCNVTEVPAQDRSVEEGADFEISSGESSERETTSLCEVAETSDPHDPHVRDAEPSVDVIEDCTWGLRKYYELPHLNLRAYDAVNEENADGKGSDDGYGAGQSSSFIEIDPIPIPGPPGSFLPSPGAMGSDEIQGNSSLTTSQSQSSHDQEDLVEGDASDSPVSAMSTVSNSAEAKTGMDYSEDTWAAFSSASKDSSSIQLANSAPAATSCGAVAETIGRANDFTIKKVPPFTRDGNEPCCCQKRINVLDYREMGPPVAVPGAARQTNRIPSGGSRLDEGYQGSIPKPAKSSNISSSRSFGEFPGSGRADCDFPSPSGSNPVLRLMGKDLIVVNKEDDAGIPDRSQSSPLAPFKSQDSQPVSQTKDYRYKDTTDYTPAHSSFTGSSSGYPGIAVPMTVHAPKLVPVGTFVNPKIASSFRAIQFDPAKFKPVGSSKQTTTKGAPLINPGKESEFTSCDVNGMNLPRDLANASRGTSPGALPTVYQTPREPISLHEPVAGSYPKGTVFINGKPGHVADGRFLQRTPPPFVATPPAFVGYQGSGYVYYPSYS